MDAGSLDSTFRYPSERPLMDVTPDHIHVGQTDSSSIGASAVRYNGRLPHMNWRGSRGGSFRSAKRRRQSASGAP